MNNVNENKGNELELIRHYIKDLSLKILVILIKINLFKIIITKISSNMNVI